MRRLVLSLAFAATVTGTARAESPPSGVPHVEPRSDAASAAQPEPSLAVPIAFAINNPLAWHWSLAFSGWVGVNDHHAIRANFARYRGPLWDIIPNVFAGEGSDLDEGDIPPDFGQTTDVSLGWVYFPRRVLDGATFEIGGLLRLNRLRDRIDRMNVASEEQFTNVYGARALIGWTWRISDWWFLALGAGASAGYERGREKVFLGYDFSKSPSDVIREGRVSRVAASLEAYLRVGLAFGQ
ncbi:MAG TPA: hypothetical protein VIX73_16500 [Kofleriaceae bacterium]|jgi:hypothetical protein